jgi:hypothetical protein
MLSLMRSTTLSRSSPKQSVFAFLLAVRRQKLVTASKLRPPAVDAFERLSYRSSQVPSYDREIADEAGTRI